MRSQGNPRILSQTSKLVLQVYRSVASRDAAISRLQLLERNLTSHVGKVDEIQTNLLALRHATLDCVEAVAAWRGESNAVWVDPQTSANFLEKIKTDTDWLGKGEISRFFLFADKPDPFLVHPSKGKGKFAPLPLSKTDVDRIRRAEKILADEKFLLKSLRPVSGHPLDTKFAFNDRRTSEPALTVTKYFPSLLPVASVDVSAVPAPPAVVAPHPPPGANFSRLQELASAIVADLPGIIEDPPPMDAQLEVPSNQAPIEQPSPIEHPTPTGHQDVFEAPIPEDTLAEEAAQGEETLETHEPEEPAYETEDPAVLERTGDAPVQGNEMPEEPQSVGSEHLSTKRSEISSGTGSRRWSDGVPTLVPHGEEIYLSEISMPGELGKVLELTGKFQVHEGEVGQLVEQDLQWRWVKIGDLSAGLLVFRSQGNVAEIVFVKTEVEADIGNLLQQEISDLQSVKLLTGEVVARPSVGRNFRLHVMNVLALGSREIGNLKKSQFFQRPNVGSPVLVAEAVRKLGGGRMHQQIGNVLEIKNTEIFSLRDKLRDAMIDLPEISCSLVPADFKFPFTSETSFGGARELLVADFTADLTLNMRKFQNASLAFPIQAVAQADKETPKIFYLATSHPEIFVFVFSAEAWESEEDSLANVSELLQRSEIRKSRKYDFLGLPRVTKRSQDFTDAFDGLPVGTDRLGRRLLEHVQLSLGPEDQDTLVSLTSAEEERTCYLREPFMLGIWHSALDKFDMPLVFFRVLPDPRRLYADGHHTPSMRRSISGINTNEGCEVVPVAAETGQFEAQFQTYAQRCRDQRWSPEDQWLSLHKATLSHRGREAPRWYWLCKKSGDKVGLLVYRVMGLKRTVHVLHLSVVRNEFMSVAVKFAKLHIFSCNKSAKFIRVSLTHERESLTLDSVFDAAYKEQGFRWFQMTQTEDGERVTVMSVARNTLEDGEIDETEETASIFLRQANVLGFSEKSAELPRRPTSLAIGNRVVLAQSLRALRVADPPRICGPGNFVCDLGVHMDKAQTYVKCVDAEKSSSTSEARMKAAEILEFPDFSYDRWAIAETGESVAEYLVGCMQVDAEIPGVLPAQPLQALREYETSVVEVVSMSRTSDGRAIYFFRTENPELIIFVATAGDVSGGVDLFREVDRWLKSSKQEISDHQYLMIPAFAFESLRHTDAFGGIKTAEALYTGRLFELTKFAVRGAGEIPGVLKTQLDIHNTEVITEDFVFGLWHASLDDIDVPLFATLVDTSVWIKKIR